jgi:hypothetical protein
MSTVEVKSATSIRASGSNWITLYTVPAGKQAVVRTVTATNTAQTSVTLTPNLGLRRSGTVTRLSRASIATSTSANLLPAAITMIAGDELVTIEAAGDTFGEVVIPSLPDGASSPVAIVDGSTIICAGSSGIFRSTNSGVTFSQVSSLSSSTGFASAKIGTNYFIYQSATSAYRSTDGGATWTTQAVTNAPNVAAGAIGLRTSAPGRIVFNGTVHGGLTTSTRLSTTTDGITWTNVAAAFPATVDCLVWSGTHWIAGRDGTASEIYRSTDGASWSTVTARTASSGTAVGGLASDGAGLIITGGMNGDVIGRSTNHGATWTDVTVGFNVTDASNHAAVMYIGSNFLAYRTSDLAVFYSPTALTGSFINTGAVGLLTAGSSDNTYGFDATNVFYARNGIRRFPLTLPTAYAGMDVAAAILEVTP